MTMTPSVVIGAMFITSWVIILGLVGFDPWKNRRLRTFLGRWREAPTINDDIELFLADLLAQNFLFGSYADALRSDMKIMDLYYLYRRTSPLDDMEFEHLIMAVEKKYQVRFMESEVLDLGTIRSFALVIRSKRDQSALKDLAVLESMANV